MQPISTAPRDGTDILVFHKIHGWMTAHFLKGEWAEHHEYGKEYNGPIWCFGDDVFQEEVEEDGTTFHDGQVTHWMSAPEKPNAS